MSIPYDEDLGACSCDIFFASVVATVYVCHARIPLTRHVEFHLTCIHEGRSKDGKNVFRKIGRIVRENGVLGAWSGWDDVDRIRGHRQGGFVSGQESMPLAVPGTAALKRPHFLTTEQTASFTSTVQRRRRRPRYFPTLRILRATRLLRIPVPVSLPLRYHPLPTSFWLLS